MLLLRAALWLSVWVACGLIVGYVIMRVRRGW
jgi:hypothetical protein